MNAVALRFYIDCERVKAEIEAMKAANENRARVGLSQAYTEEQFQRQAEALSFISEQLLGFIKDGLAK